VGTTRFAAGPEPKLTLYGTSFDKDDRTKAVEIVRRLRWIRGASVPVDGGSKL
jgi:hypothetical protein